MKTKRQQQQHEASNRYREKNREKINARQKKWREDNKEKFAVMKKRSILKNTYGITLEEYDAILKTQKGGCAICKVKAKILCVDHCHKTGKVRGLLCQLCNRSIGMMKDDISILESAIVYLKSHV